MRASSLGSSPRAGFETRLRAACRAPRREVAARRWRRSFFERLLRRLVGLGVARAHRQAAIAERVEDAPDRALVQLDAEAPLQIVAQIDAPPAHNAMRVAIRPVLDDLRQLLLLRRRQPRRRSRRGAIAKARQPFPVVAVNPVAQRLAVAPLRARLLRLEAGALCLRDGARALGMGANPAVQRIALKLLAAGEPGTWKVRRMSEPTTSSTKRVV